MKIGITTRGTERPIEIAPIETTGTFGATTSERIGIGAISTAIATITTVTAIATVTDSYTPLYGVLRLWRARSPMALELFSVTASR